MTKPNRTAVVMGSGIAGLSIAEILSRNGWKVIIVEAQKSLGGEASLCTQKWLHTGWLYSALPHPAAMRGCSESLRLYKSLYGPLFDDGRVNVAVTPGAVEYPPAERAWFRDERIHYLYPLSAYDFSWAQKIYWRYYLRAVPFRRLRSAGYPVVTQSHYDAGLAQTVDRWEARADAHKDYLFVRSTDAMVETRSILASMVEALGADAEVVTDADCRITSVDGQSRVRLNGAQISPDLLVLAAGKAIPGLLRQIGADVAASQIKSIKSPILVLKQRLPFPSFIRFTPNVPHTMNHIRYTTSSGELLSTLGSYDFMPVEAPVNIAAFREKMCRRMGLSTADVAGEYYGIKTEYVGSLERRYNHAVERVNSNTFFALAGKFCQFPVLVKDFMNQMGLSAAVKRGDRGELGLDRIALTLPEAIIRDSRKCAAKVNL